MAPVAGGTEIAEVELVLDPRLEQAQRPRAIGVGSVFGGLEADPDVALGG